MELYAEQPTDEQIAEARRALAETLARQERARLTLEARRCPRVLALLDDAFERLQLLDPERHVRVAIARYPLSTVANGISVFDGKRRTSTLPDGVDARYLLGIVRNISSQEEAEYILEAAIKIRRDLQNSLLAPLREERDALCKTGDLPRIVDTCVERALEIPPSLERTFWLEALGDLLRALPAETRDLFLARASRRIHATFDVPPDERQAATLAVVSRALPIG